MYEENNAHNSNAHGFGNHHKNTFGDQNDNATYSNPFANFRNNRNKHPS